MSKEQRTPTKIDSGCFEQICVGPANVNCCSRKTEFLLSGDMLSLQKYLTTFTKIWTTTHEATTITRRTRYHRTRRFTPMRKEQPRTRLTHPRAHCSKNNPCASAVVVLLLLISSDDTELRRRGQRSGSDFRRAADAMLNMFTKSPCYAHDRQNFPVVLTQARPFLGFPENLVAASIDQASSTDYPCVHSTFTVHSGDP